ncbi:putative dihydrofolate reductase [Pseudomonas phage PaMx28]|uniref:Putative dihydrofolate reductase n=1 Tax=Pseudomonas phage PaMx28 TaxID=1175659 RepID=A0A0S0N6M4_9CAUD|nr:dihydrofolate reductase [Pseudomonas phage PaMx28]ALH23649.1 putative dihydrofolate reductase [Pseudomonas phage PaMx28]
MKLILAVSRDGFLASGPDDDMRWTGPADKYAFRLLTLSDGEPLLAGKQTARLMPPLPGRDIVHLSRSTLPLDMAGRLMREAWLIGGPTVAMEALRLGLVHRAFIHRTQHVLGEGIPFAPLRELLPKEPWGFVKNDALVIELYREDQQWPVR